jgi:hypothetical protein
MVSFIADERAQLDHGWPLLAVWVVPPDAELDSSDYAPFRVDVSELPSVEANINEANLDWDDFARSVDDDGVYRGSEGAAYRRPDRAPASSPPPSRIGTGSSGQPTGPAQPPVPVRESWTSIVQWCRSNAPATFADIRPALSDGERTQWLDTVPCNKPAEFLRWYRLQDGVDPASIGTPLPGFRILSVAEIAGTIRDYWETFPPHHPDVAAAGHNAAGTVPHLFLIEFVPIGQSADGSTLFVDTRQGPQRDCVTEWNRDRRDAGGPKWSSIGAMLEHVSFGLETGAPCNGLAPVVRNRRLAWEPAA